MNEFIFPFERLDVWDLSISLSQYVLSLLEQLSPNKHMRLISQLESAVTSPAQNIAEGKGRQYKKEFIQFLYIAQGSIFEVVTLTEVFQRQNLFSPEEAKEIRIQCEQIVRKINGLIKSLQGSKKQNVSESK
jgi:four helix bundle protein